MAKTFWPGQSATGRHLRYGGIKEYATVIGVVGDIKNGGMSRGGRDGVISSGEAGE
jgi:hypothetical protein